MFIPISASEPAMIILARTPKSIAPHVLAFCEQINPSFSPVYLTIEPEAGCLARECFPNVRQKVEREGGRICYGWVIWEWPRVFIEAEHHAVYEGPDGSWQDLTPTMPEDPENERLFLPDARAVYDFNNPGERRDNIRHALTQDSHIEEYLQLSAELSEIIRRIPGSPGLRVTVPRPDAIRIQAISKRRSHLQREIAHRYTAQGDPCYCGSGRKFKRCHGQPRKVRL